MLLPYCMTPRYWSSCWVRDSWQAETAALVMDGRLPCSIHQLAATTAWQETSHLKACDMHICRCKEAHMCHARQRHARERHAHKHTCIASGSGTGHCQVFQESVSGFLTGGAPGLLLRPYLLQVTALGPQIYAPSAVQFQPLHMSLLGCQHV